MKKIKPSGYNTAAETAIPGYLARRMEQYRKKMLAEQLKAEAEKREQQTDEKLLRLRSLTRRAA